MFSELHAAVVMTAFLEAFVSVLKEMTRLIIKPSKNVLHLNSSGCPSLLRLLGGFSCALYVQIHRYFRGKKSYSDRGLQQDLFPDWFVGCAITTWGIKDVLHVWYVQLKPCSDRCTRCDTVAFTPVTLKLNNS